MKTWPDGYPYSTFLYTARKSRVIGAATKVSESDLFFI